MTKMRVLLILHELSLTGAPKVAIELFRELTAKVEVHVLTLEDGPLREQACMLGAVTNIQDLYYDHSLRGSIARKQKRYRLESLLKQWKPDVIYVNSVAGLRALQVTSYSTTPVLLHVHEMEAVIRFVMGGDMSLLTERPAGYIAASEAVKRTLTDKFHINANKIAVVHECISPDTQHTHSVKAQENTPFIVGGAGTPELRKGITLWLQVAAELVSKVGKDKVRFQWVGVRNNLDGELFRVMTQKLGLESCVELIPLTPDPLAYFAGFDLLAMTSWEDPCPLVVLEAMLLEKPVACFTAGGGAVEEIGDTGLAIDRFSPGAMADAIAELMQSPERRAEMGRRARTRVLENFIPAVQAPKIEAQMRNLANHNRLRA